MTLTRWSLPVQRLSRQLHAARPRAFHTTKDVSFGVDDRALRRLSPRRLRWMNRNSDRIGPLQAAPLITFSSPLDEAHPTAPSTPLDESRPTAPSTPLEESRPTAPSTPLDEAHPTAPSTPLDEGLPTAPPDSNSRLRLYETWRQSLNAVITSNHPRESTNRILGLFSHNLWPDARHWAEKILDDPRESITSSQNTNWHPGKGTSWIHLPNPVPAKSFAVWASALLYTLVNDTPARAADLLARTYSWNVARQCHPSAGPNILWAIIRKATPQLEHDPDLNKQLINLVCTLYTAGNSYRAYPFPGAIIAFLIRHCQPSDALRLYNLSQDPVLDTHGLTLLHVSKAMAKHGYMEDAADALLMAVQRSVSPDHPVYKSVCTTILHKIGPTCKGLRHSLDLFERLVKVGLRANITICNVLIHNAALCGDLRTVWDVYNSLCEHGLPPDDYTFQTMLKACKIKNHDTDNIQSTFQEVLASRGKVPGLHVATSIIDVLYRHHFQNENGSSRDFYRLAAAYSSMFETAHLDFIDPAQNAAPQAVKGKTTLLQPNVQTLTLMVKARCQAIHCDHADEADLYRLFGVLYYLALAKHEPYVTLLNTDHIWNELVYAALRLGYTTTAFRIVSELLDPTSVRSGSKRTEVYRHDWSRLRNLPDKISPAVTRRTWSIILEKSLTDWRHFERLLQFMYEFGIEPSISPAESIKLVEAYALRLAEGLGPLEHTGRLVADEELRDDVHDGVDDQDWTSDGYAGEVHDAYAENRLGGQESTRNDDHDE